MVATASRGVRAGQRREDSIHRREREVVTQYLKVAPGQGPACIRPSMAAGASTSGSSCGCTSARKTLQPDRVIVKGVPDLEMEDKGGVHGDRATAAMVVNSISARDQRAAGCVDHGRHSN